MRQIVLDTETTGLDPAEGHRIIEIGAVELENRRLTGRSYHQYLNPDREVEQGALEVHGITTAFLQDKPRFADIVDELLVFLRGAELIIHNAPFDVGFINHELKLVGGEAAESLQDLCAIVDTLQLARDRHPGQKNSLDALCRRYEVDNSARDLHGALLDAQILADVYLAMTGGQTVLMLDDARPGEVAIAKGIQRLPSDRPRLPVLKAGAEELAAHSERLDAIDKASGGNTLWRKWNA